VAAPVSVSNSVPSSLPCSAMVSLRALQEAGTFKVTLPTRSSRPRSTCAHCGSFLPELCQ